MSRKPWIFSRFTWVYRLQLWFSFWSKNSWHWLKLRFGYCQPDKKVGREETFFEYFSSLSRQYKNLGQKEALELFAYFSEELLITSFKMNRRLANFSVQKAVCFSSQEVDGRLWILQGRLLDSQIFPFGPEGNDLRWWAVTVRKNFLSEEKEVDDFQWFRLCQIIMEESCLFLGVPKDVLDQLYFRVATALNEYLPDGGMVSSEEMNELIKTIAESATK